MLASCLIDRFKWSAESAGPTARQIGDSVALAVQRLTDDSVAAAKAEAVLADVNDAADQAKAGPSADEFRLAMIWVGSKRSKLYYRGHCVTAKAVRGADREEFSNDKMAERSGYQRSTAAADQLCYQDPAL